MYTEIFMPILLIRWMHNTLLLNLCQLNSTQYNTSKLTFYQEEYILCRCIEEISITLQIVPHKTGQPNPCKNFKPNSSYIARGCKYSVHGINPNENNNQFKKHLYTNKTLSQCLNLNKSLIVFQSFVISINFDFFLTDESLMHFIYHK